MIRLKVVFCFSKQCEFSPLRMNFHRSSVNFNPQVYHAVRVLNDSVDMLLSWGEMFNLYHEKRLLCENNLKK